jgi:hypothetical protein
MTRLAHWLLVIVLILGACEVGCATVGKPGDSYPRKRDPESEDDDAHLWSD